ncbi:MAG: NlpC/P60 family protein [Armatimonadota bacterium]
MKPSRLSIIWSVVIFLLLVSSAVVIRASIMTGRSRIILALTAVSILFTIIYLVYRLISHSRRTAYVIVPLLLLTAILISLNSRPVDTADLRVAYMRQLTSFTGTPFTWGGETQYGIDCSGLARTALWQSMLSQGIRTFNPRLFGLSLWKFWWQDISADGMGDEVFGYTKVIGRTEGLSDDKFIMNPGYSLQKGDLAVTTGHVLVYRGDGIWIEASPQDLKVVSNRSSGSNRPYFNMHAKIVRWWILE